MTALLPVGRVAKPWGVDALPAPFGSADQQRIGEIWFGPPPQMPDLLVKYIFTSEKLSIQTHPTDAQVAARGLGSNGKNECWVVVDAQPGAQLGIGFDQPIDSITMRSAALDGSIEARLMWHDAAPGDFFFIPANTVHAIGGGLTLVEIQQNSDLTYRLYDYGRPRELHLDDGLMVASGTVYDSARHRKTLPGNAHCALVDGPSFRVDWLCGPPDAGVIDRYHGPVYVIPRDGAAYIGDEQVQSGACGLAPTLDAIRFDAGGKYLIAQSL